MLATPGPLRSPSCTGLVYPGLPDRACAHAREVEPSPGRQNRRDIHGGPLLVVGQVRQGFYAHAHDLLARSRRTFVKLVAIIFVGRHWGQALQDECKVNLLFTTKLMQRDRGRDLNILRGLSVPYLRLTYVVRSRDPYRFVPYSPSFGVVFHRIHARYPRGLKFIVVCIDGQRQLTRSDALIICLRSVSRECRIYSAIYDRDNQ